MTTKHTPGEWKYDGTWGLIHGPKGEEICAIHAGVDPASNRPPKGVAQANAAYIVRACNAHGELVHALETIARITDGSQPVDYPGAIMVARAALSKVGGE